MTAAPVLDTAAHNAAPPTTIETPSLLGVDPTTHPRPPQSLADLHLDAVVDAAAPGDFQRAAWYCPLGDPALVAQRQDVVADLQRGDLRTAAQEFVAAVDQARIAADATRKEYYRVPGDVQLLAALHRYADALAMFGARLAERPPGSARLSGVADAVAARLRSPRHTVLADTSGELLDELRATPVELGIAADTVWADYDDGHEVWGPRVAEVLARFGDGRPAGVREQPPNRSRKPSLPLSRHNRSTLDRELRTAGRATEANAVSPPSCRHAAHEVGTVGRRSDSLN